MSITYIYIIFLHSKIKSGDASVAVWFLFAIAPVGCALRIVVTEGYKGYTGCILQISLAVSLSRIRRAMYIGKAFDDVAAEKCSL